MTKHVDSLLNYIGHKSKIISQILPHLPTDVRGTFYDCFAGSAVVALNVPYKQIVGVEINPFLSQLYSDLSDVKFEPTLLAMINGYNLTNSSVVPRSEYLKNPNIGTVTWMGEKIPNLHLDQLNKPGYTQLLADFNSGAFTGVAQSVAYMIATIYGRNSSVSTDLVTRELKGGIGPLDYSKRAAEKFVEHQRVLSAGRHSFTTGSYRDIQPTENDFVYMDPPYLASSYRYSGWTENDERDLLSWIDQLTCPWALSNTFQSGDKMNSLLIEWAQDKQVIELNKRYRIWSNKAETAKRTAKINREVLILPKPL